MKKQLEDQIVINGENSKFQMSYVDQIFDFQKIDLSVIDRAKNPKNGCAYSGRTKHTFKSNFRLFLKHLGKNNLVLCEESLREYLEMVRNEFSSNTFSTRRNAIRRVLENQVVVINNWQFKERLKSLFSDFVPPKQTRVVHDNKYLSYDEVQKIVSYGMDPNNVPVDRKRRQEKIRRNKRNALICEALFQTASRITAFLNIKLTDCRIDGNYVWLYLKEDKFSKSRSVCIQKRLYDEILEAFKSKEYLFENESGNQCFLSNVAKSIKEFAVEAGVEKNVHPHIFRHSYAMVKIYGKNPMESIKKKVDSSDVQKVANYLGHERVDTTYKYYVYGQFTAEDALDFG